RSVRLARRLERHDPSLVSVATQLHGVQPAVCTRVEDQLHAPLGEQPRPVWPEGAIPADLKSHPFADSLQRRAGPGSGAGPSHRVILPTWVAGQHVGAAWLIAATR